MEADRDGDAVVGEIGSVATPERRVEVELARLITVDLIPALRNRNQVVGIAHDAGDSEIDRRALRLDGRPLPGRAELGPRVGPDAEGRTDAQVVPPGELLVDRRLVGTIRTRQSPGHDHRTTEYLSPNPIQPYPAELSAGRGGAERVRTRHDQRHDSLGGAHLRQGRHGIQLSGYVRTGRLAAPAPGEPHGRVDGVAGGYEPWQRRVRAAGPGDRGQHHAAGEADQKGQGQAGQEPPPELGSCP